MADKPVEGLSGAALELPQNFAGKSGAHVMLNYGADSRDHGAGPGVIIFITN